MALVEKNALRELSLVHERFHALGNFFTDIRPSIMKIRFRVCKKGLITSLSCLLLLYKSPQKKNSDKRPRFRLFKIRLEKLGYFVMIFELNFDSYV